ncbi:hypothetical protein, partial [Helicobacter suis]|uniref:hypothetical protein n=1 Tax=Helicobacter suis TaxID=104628 RepID=UPI0013D73A30
MKPPEDMTQEELANLIRSKPVDLSNLESDHIPRLTKNSFIHHKGKHAGEWRDQAEERKVRQYVLKHMGNFDITK